MYASSFDVDQTNSSRKSIALLTGSVVFLKASNDSALSTTTSERRCGRDSADIFPGCEDRMEGMIDDRMDI